MTSLLSPPTRSASGLAADLRHRRPLVLVATIGGVSAALATLVVCLAVGVVGWFLTDAGAHGTPRDALRAGALGWLMAHGSGLVVRGTPVTAVPLGLSLVCAWTVWRTGLRVGDSVSGHGPDADRISDGERDLTVPLATALFAVAYAVTALVVAALAGTASTSPSSAGVLLWSLALGVLVGGAGVAVGAGRAAIWVSALPVSVRAAVATGWSVLLHFLGASVVLLLVALAVDLSTAVNILSQLHTDLGASVLYLGVTALALPNAVGFAGSYLLGPGFAVGAGTLVSPGVVSVGALPMFPLLAALPDAGATPPWTPWLVVLAPLTAVVAVVRTQRRLPTLHWDEGALRGMAGGMLAALCFSVLAALAGGAVGPGRMAQVGPFVGDVLVHSLSAFGLAGLLAGLAVTWWQRRTLGPEPVAD